MTTLTLFVIALLALVAGLILFRVIPAVQTYFTYRGKRLVTCPETLRNVAVDVAARKAATWAFVGEPALRLDQCSRWPERRDCGQEFCGRLRPIRRTAWSGTLCPIGMRDKSVCIATSTLDGFIILITLQPSWDLITGPLSGTMSG